MAYHFVEFYNTSGVSINNFSIHTRDKVKAHFATKMTKATTLIISKQ